MMTETAQFIADALQTRDRDESKKPSDGPDYWRLAFMARSLPPAAKDRPAAEEQAKNSRGYF